MTKDILTGITVTTIIVAVSFALPLIGFFFIVFVPLPTIYFRSKLGRKPGAAIPAAVLFFAAVMAGGLVPDVFFLLLLFALGLGVAELFDRKADIEKNIGYPSLMVWCGALICMLFYSVVKNVNVVSMITQYVSVNLNHTLTLYREMGVPEETIQLLETAIPQLKKWLVWILPGLSMAMILFVAWINVIAVRPIFLIKGLPFPDLGALNRWQSPEMLIWGVVAAGLMMVIPGEAITILGINAMLILFVIYFFQGIAIVSFFFEKKKFPPAARAVLYSLIGFQNLLWFIIAGLGFFDVWLDIRRLNNSEQIAE